MRQPSLPLNNYSGFADFLGPRWHYYLGDLIAAIPVPMIFAKGDFESGVAAKILNDFAENPLPYLDEDGKKKMIAVTAALLEKFRELAFDEMAEMRWRESQPAEADEIDLGPVTAADLQDDLLADSSKPF